jgi:hypothetical protein
MKYYLVSLFAFLLLLLPGCQSKSPVCLPESITYISNSSSFAKISSSEDTKPSPTAELVEINGKMMHVDNVIQGPLCYGKWDGTVYVSCDLQIYEWGEDPTFLQNCDLTIEPGTIVYVASHNDAPYYKGCSCHTGEEPTE